MCRLQRWHHSGQGYLHGWPEQNPRAQCEGPRQKGWHPRPPRVRERGQKTQMNGARQQQKNAISLSFSHVIADDDDDNDEYIACLFFLKPWFSARSIYHFSAHIIGLCCLRDELTDSESCVKDRSRYAIVDELIRSAQHLEYRKVQQKWLYASGRGLPSLQL